jgi:hypothetical protein
MSDSQPPKDYIPTDKERADAAEARIVKLLKALKNRDERIRRLIERMPSKKRGW